MLFIKKKEKIKKPNRRLRKAIKEVERISKDPNAKTYTDLKEMWKDLKL